ncbi:LytR/AlgR family response regulator transcription factor [Alkalibacterium kapii]|uniref:DNA-binding response regulator n=1 Tax=Alkalibacterium kapii TaxID=426704 RepID=A0A511AUK1_9LACT|nr:LytTR family DNA-binding domain-containing protein [Alkalibacterium kapii]GEK91814.1 DNA-binding response regulator [Alkalibacterium kapii]
MSKNIHIAVVDDETIQLDTMISLITQAAKKVNLISNISAFSSGESFLFELEDQPDMDMVFLDIEMKQVDGLKVAKKIREKNQQMTIVFATAYTEYAVQGYDVQALDYLLKPIKVGDVVRVLKRHLDRKPFARKTITIETQGEISKIDQEEILYIEVNRRECAIHLKDKILTVNETLKELADRLSNDFIQTHRSYLINVAHINRLISKDAELSNGEQVPVSRRLIKDVQERFIAYHKETVFYND